jgi:hypothetical protein
VVVVEVGGSVVVDVSGGVATFSEVVVIDELVVLEVTGPGSPVEPGSSEPQPAATEIAVNRSTGSLCVNRIGILWPKK